ncbi:MAG: hypothetical protein Faunusvirus59_4 [Faunusvirus sp.]|jgi:hypothetical protein|uniref:Uncharacterized protein n=1 Tax=Faunusvirus sp. TaxID=2487766 RepID=A0A3G4ZY35_9VIRU|nr:MAG: hypothetical protein Faunusvirus59_4 [Faunusvirus sp.]
MAALSAEAQRNKQIDIRYSLISDKTNRADPVRVVYMAITVVKIAQT